MDKRSAGFETWPAIDLMGGEMVRLRQGNFAQKTSYGDDFEAIIEAFESFATGLHIIDLDGAASGRVQNATVVREIIRKTKLPVQLGGGIRSLEAIEYWLSCGVSRVIIGTKALTDVDWLERCLGSFGAEKIVVSVDVKEGKVMTKGWTQSNDIGAFAFIEDQIKKGFQKFMVTDIEQDGTLQGASTELYKSLRRKFPNIYLLAAGGVGSIEDLQDLKATGINGAIFGKAFYEGKIEVKNLRSLES